MRFGSKPHASSHTYNKKILRNAAGVKIWDMPVSLHSTLTLKLRITQRIIPVYVCMPVCQPVHTGILSTNSLPLLPSTLSFHLSLASSDTGRKKTAP